MGVIIKKLGEGMTFENNTLRIRANATVEYLIADSGVLTIEVGKNAQCAILEQLYTARDSTVHIKMRLAENSLVQFVSIENSMPVSNTVQRTMTIAKNAALHAVYVTIGSKQHNHTRNTVLQGCGSEITEQEMFLGSHDQELSTNTNITNDAASTKASVLVRGVLAGSAKAICKGVMKITNKGQKSKSKLGQHVLLLSREAKAETFPYLEIENNDVQATHAASVSPIDPEHIFYLQSRGISQQDATRMIAENFLNPVFESIPMQEARERLAFVLQQKWKEIHAARTPEVRH